MSKCAFNYDDGCDAVATTTLTKNNGEVVQLCERHHDYLIHLFMRIAGGDRIVEYEDAESAASHWLVKNKIPS